MFPKTFKIKWFLIDQQMCIVPFNFSNAKWLVVYITPSGQTVDPNNHGIHISVSGLVSWIWPPKLNIFNFYTIFLAAIWWSSWISQCIQNFYSTLNITINFLWLVMGSGTQTPAFFGALTPRNGTQKFFKPKGNATFLKPEPDFCYTWTHHYLWWKII